MLLFIISHHASYSLQENFLCAFTAPELLASLDTEYRVERTNNHNEENTDIAKRLLTIWDRKLGRRSSQPLLGPVDLACQMGREETSNFFTELCGRKVVCVVAKDAPVVRSSSRIGKHHTHQFGNTSSGVKNNNGDTRTIHIINENTVKQFSKAVYGEEDVVLSSTRFRPNIIIDNLEPWAEFDLIDQTIEVVPKENIDSIDPINPLRFRIVSRTVRCAGVGVDPLQPELVMDIPNLLSKHYPEHGPYLGVYAIVLDNDDKDTSRTISVGDTFRVV